MALIDALKVSNKTFDNTINKYYSDAESYAKIIEVQQFCIYEEKYKILKKDKVFEYAKKQIERQKNEIK